MARLGSQARLGFYPIDPVCMDAIIGHLAVSTANGSKGVNVIDLCCGKGAALHQIAKGLGIPMEQTYGVELDGNRTAEAKALMPDAKIAGPASIFGMKITGHSFSLAYVNGPFDNELGGGRREEQNFVEEAYRLLANEGVMVLVCPLTALNENRGFCQYIDSRFEDLRLFVLPDGISKTTGLEYRGFKEIVVIAKKRKTLLTEEAVNQYGGLHIAQFQWMNKVGWDRFLTRINKPEYYPIVCGKPQKPVPHSCYFLPPAWKPMSFHKSRYLPEELALALESSPLQKLTQEMEAHTLARPPLPPGKGHVALLLASGQLDGVVESEDGSHVVRGTAKKVEYWNEAASKSEVNPDTGCLTTKDVYSQKVVLVIRAAWQDGTLITLSDQPEEPTDEEPKPEDTNEGREPRKLQAATASAPWEG